MTANRETMVLRLLDLSGAASRADLVLDTGWGIVETNAVVDRLMAAGEVVPFPAEGNNVHRARLLCRPAVRAQHLGGRVS
jgi:hypothetical protein